MVVIIRKFYKYVPFPKNMATLTPQQLAEYRRDLDQQLRKGLLTPEEHAEALAFISGEERATQKKIIIEEASSEDLETIVPKLENRYYRELFGRVYHPELDESLANEVLVARANGEVAGALWYAPEPSPSYRGYKYLDILYVLPEQRGEKVGTYLLLALLKKSPQKMSLITFAWSNSVEFYATHGFLRTEQMEEKEGQHFQKMILPLTPECLNLHSEEMQVTPYDQYTELVEKGSYAPDFLTRFQQQVRKGSERVFQDLEQNPSTVFIYRKAGQKHGLLRTDSDRK